MWIGPLQNEIDIHTVNAAEAAYTSLFGMLLPRRGWVWASGIGQDLRLESQEWQVEHADCHVYDSTGRNYQGRLVQFFAVQPAGQGPVFLPATNLQYCGSRITLSRPAMVLRGLGVLIRKGVVIDTDQIQISVQYRVVRP